MAKTVAAKRLAVLERVALVRNRKNRIEFRICKSIDFTMPFNLLKILDKLCSEPHDLICIW